jgi:hypothetical protein
MEETSKHEVYEKCRRRKSTAKIIYIYIYIYIYIKKKTTYADMERLLFFFLFLSISPFSSSFPSGIWMISMDEVVVVVVVG